MKVCEHCGARMNGNVCEYCDMPLNDDKTVFIEPDEKIPKNSNLKSNDFAEFNFGKIFLSLTGIFILFYVVICVSKLFTVSRNVRPDTAVIHETATLTDDKNTFEVSEIKNSESVFSDGVYRIGKDIPEGYYLLVADTVADNHAVFGIYADSECKEKIYGDWFEYSKIVRLEGDSYFKISWGTAYDMSVCDIENSPFEKSGMFEVGRDVKAGEYYIISSGESGQLSEWCIYSGFDFVSPKVYDSGKVEKNGVFVSLENGQFIELKNCILQK